MSANQITELEAIVKKQGEQIERLHDTIYYMLGRLYKNVPGNHLLIYSDYNFMKFGKFCNHRWLVDEDDDGTDEYYAFAENRSKEATRRALEEHCEEEHCEEEHCEEEHCEDDEELSSSTHSSMPSLISMESSEDEDDDMPSLISVSSKEDKPEYYKLPPSSDEESNSSSSNTVSKRMRYSADLCGNN